MTTFGGGAVESAIQETAAGARLRRLSYVPDADLPALYSGAACVAIVSLYEGFGMPALEALVIGNRGSLPEIGSTAAISVDPLDVRSIAQGLERVVNDGSLSAELRRRGPRRAAEFDWATAARVTLRAFESAADTQLPSPRRFAAN